MMHGKELNFKRLVHFKGVCKDVLCAGPGAGAGTGRGDVEGGAEKALPPRVMKSRAMKSRAGEQADTPRLHLH